MNESDVRNELASRTLTCRANTTYTVSTCIEKLKDPRGWPGMKIQSCCLICLLAMAVGRETTRSA